MEALLSIAVVGTDLIPPPLVIEAPLGDVATRLDAEIMVEDCNRSDTGEHPMETWFA